MKTDEWNGVPGGKPPGQPVPSHQDWYAELERKAVAELPLRRAEELKRAQQAQDILDKPLIYF